MAEAIISRRGELKKSYALKTIMFTSNNSFEVPEAKDQKFDVRIFGGGGGGCTYYGGGGGGWMNNDSFVLNKGDVIPITIGTGGVSATNIMSSFNNGGTTAFGTYLSANGGSRPGQTRAGAGGSGGGGVSQHGFRYLGGISSILTVGGCGGNGSQFGGGGGGGSVSSYDKTGGIGGPWGGGAGGTSTFIWDNSYYVYSNGYSKWYNYNTTAISNGKSGGQYGGAGGDYNEDGVNGTNTFSNNQIDESLRGYGLKSSKYVFNTKISAGGAGGGYGGNAGNSSTTLYYQNTLGSGGSGSSGSISYNVTQHWINKISVAGGGGGGYGASGGDGANAAGGGGGGYGGKGGNGFGFNGGGGGGYGPGADNKTEAGFAGGGCGGKSGGPGICIIQYYA